MKIAIISDAHLFQTFVEDYDSVKDLEKAIELIKTKTDPDMLFLGGDMFDYKKTETIYLRHYEGESYMMKIRKIIENFGKPVYAIKGNHDKEEILKGLEQTVDNFHYAKNDVKNFGKFAVCFMDSFYETGGYGATIVNDIEDLLEKALSKLHKWNNTSILLCHETFAPYDSAIPDNLVEIIKKNFDLVINGHMHLWNPKTYNSDHLVCLPSLLPSKIAKGKYSMEKYDWLPDKSKFEKNETVSPFGYVTLDTKTKTVQLHQLTPSKRIVQITLDVSGLSLEESRKRMKKMFSEINERADKTSLIVLPELKGESSFSPLHIDGIKEDFPDLHIESIRYQEITLKTTFESKTLSRPILTIEQLHEEMIKETPAIRKEIKAKGIEIDEKALRTLLKELLYEEIISKSSSTQQTRTRIRNVLSPTIEALGNSVKHRRPENFEDNLGSLLKMVR